MSMPKRIGITWTEVVHQTDRDARGGFRVIPPTILTLAEIRNGTGFARGVRFVELPDPSKGRVL